MGFSPANLFRKKFMAGEYDKKFEEITGILQKMQRSVGGMDELRMEVRDIRKELGDVRTEVRENTSDVKALNSDVKALNSDVKALNSDVKALNSNLKALNKKVDILSGQFQDVGVMAVKDHKRIDFLEQRVDVLESEPH